MQTFTITLYNQNDFHMITVEHVSLMRARKALKDIIEEIKPSETDYLMRFFRTVSNAKNAYGSASSTIHANSDYCLEISKD